MSGQGLEVNVDLVMCIDATGSMKPVIEEVKNNALTFYKKFSDALAEKDRDVKELRLKVIVFRDYYCDGDKAMEESRMFSLPDESGAFEAFVRGIEAFGGGDEPENGLEALALAMKTDWVTTGVKNRHVIMIMTDASAHPLEKASSDGKPSNYPDNMPNSFAEISEWWNDPQTGRMPKPKARRLIILAPDAYPWSDIATKWELTTQSISRAGEGMGEMDMEGILTTVANTI